MFGAFWFSAQADTLVKEWECLLTPEPLFRQHSEQWPTNADTRLKPLTVGPLPEAVDSWERDGTLSREDVVERGPDTAAHALRTRVWFFAGLAIYSLPAVCFCALLLAAPLLCCWGSALWLLAELAFLLLHKMEKQRACSRVIIGPEPDPADIRLLLQRVMELKEVVDARSFISRWFHGAPIETIKRGNLLEFLSYAFYERHYSQLSPKAMAAVQEHVSTVESAWGMHFPEGFTEGLDFMAHNREPLRALHHPLALYVWSSFVSQMTGFVLQFWGFERQEAGCLTYYYRPALHKTTLEPRVFIHGLGIGVTPYLPFLSTLLSNPYRASVVVELPHVALRIVSRPPTMDETVSALAELHQRHSLPPACYIAHSYGSLVLARLRLLQPELVASAALIDPVSLLLCLPDVVHNFIYRKPRGDNLALLVADWMRWYFCSRELHVAQALCRNFNWGKVMLWPDQLPKRTVVMLAGRDGIVPSNEIRKHLQKHAIPVVWNEHFQHAEFLFNAEVQQTLLQAMEGWK